MTSCCHHPCCYIIRPFGLIILSQALHIFHCHSWKYWEFPKYTFPSATRIHPKGPFTMFRHCRWSTVAKDCMLATIFVSTKSVCNCPCKNKCNLQKCVPYFIKVAFKARVAHKECLKVHWSWHQTGCSPANVWHSQYKYIAKDNGKWRRKRPAAVV